ncbi:ARMC8 [Mytilus edulis]|uniref:Armadillo repeat-containing protein 8 n=1 Tax=Mytilus edulis TaxID=6550 RepID=A0A8S3TK56_MYTED|nr:ARMC8 [Mytilus edulis]
MIQTAMEVDSGWECVNIILADEQDKWMESIVLLQWMIDDGIPIELRTEAAIVLGSLAKGSEEELQTLVNAGSVNVLLMGITNNNIKFVEACLRCLKTIFLMNDPPVHLIYENKTVIPHMINIISKSLCTQECITTLFSRCCNTKEHQEKLCMNGALATLAPLLTSTIYKVQMPTLKSIAVLCYQNEEVAKATATATYNGESIPSLLVKLLARDKTSEMQMAAARCLTYLCRGGALQPSSNVIMFKALPTVIRMCKKDRTLEENVEGAETLAYLIEEDPELQGIAAISDHIIKTLAEYLRYTDVQQFNSRTTHKKIIETENLMDHIISGMNSEDIKVKAAAVRCLHSLSRSVQQLRTTFQDHVVWKPLMNVGSAYEYSYWSLQICTTTKDNLPRSCGLEAINECRSVQQLRTTFQDHVVWKPLMNMIQNGPENLLVITSSTLCNLLLEFSPGREVNTPRKAILDTGAIGILVTLTGRNESELRLNGIWGLMNMAFQSELKVKSQIIEAIGTEQLFKLLSDPDPNILMKTLGLIRNLLSGKPHIDSIMSVYGTQIMQAVVFILEGDHSADIKEQIFFILTNVADGDDSKGYIMENED